MDELLDCAKAVYTGELQILCPAAQIRWADGADRKPMAGVGLIVSGKESTLSVRFSGSDGGEGVDVPDIAFEAGLLPPKELSASIEFVDDCGYQWKSAVVQLHPVNAVFPNRQRWLVPTERVTRVLPTTGRAPYRMRAILRSAHCFPLPQSRFYEEKEGDKIVRTGMRGAFARFGIEGADAIANRIDDEWIELSVERQEPFTHEWAAAIATSLEFMTKFDCTPPAYQVDLAESIEMTLHAGPFRRYRSSLPRPAGFTEPTLGSEFWYYFAKLVQFLLADETRGRAVAGELHAIRQGSNTTLPTASLTLTASIESLVFLLVDKALVTPAPSECEELQRAIQLANVSEEMRNRAVGAIAQLRAVRAGDLLRAWAAIAGCPLELIKQWSVLRNKSAHGVEIQSTQENWDLFSANAELLHRLVGWAIGYAGRIVESSKRGRPAVWIGPKS